MIELSTLLKYSDPKYGFVVLQGELDRDGEWEFHSLEVTESDAANRIESEYNASKKPFFYLPLKRWLDMVATVRDGYPVRVVSIDWDAPANCRQWGAIRPAGFRV